MRTDRMNAMEQYILKNGSVSLDNLVNTFHVSMNTVRRDIASLLERGNVRKVYGGVCAIPKVSPEPVAPISIRASENSSEKEIIGRRAANLVKDHSSIFLDSGSTTEKIIPYLADKQDITVITYSLSAMYEASKYPSIRLVALGGVYSPDTDSFVGLSTAKNTTGMQIDIVFLAASSITIQGGLANNNYLEAEIKRSVLNQNTGKVIVAMADHSKFEKSSIFSFCPIDSLNAIVTDQAPSEELLKKLTAMNIECICTD